MSNVRQPSVAGTFYPADPGHLRDQVEELLATARLAASVHDADASSAVAAPPKALIAPHAGYLYSGPIAASAFARIEPLRGVIERVVIVGPSHFVPFAGMALPPAEALRTPLGEVAVEAAARRALSALESIVTAEEPHGREHCIEVEIPFLQQALGDFVIVPLVTGQASPEEVAAALELVWGGAETLIVISSDLSHFLDYEAARRLDAETATAIEEQRGADLGPQSACGRLAIQGLLRAAQGRGAGVSVLDLRNSGDTAGTRDEVVGYGAFAIG